MFPTTDYHPATVFFFQAEDGIRDADVTGVQTCALPISPEIKIRENDILIVKTGSTYGKIGIVKNLPQKATINPQLLVLKKMQIKADYLYELLKSEIFQLQVERNVIGSTIPTISEAKILGFSVPIPSSEEEINEISDYILNINEKIAKAIMLKEQEIEKLKEYKTVLIDNVVTGKIKVS